MLSSNENCCLFSHQGSMLFILFSTESTVPFKHVEFESDFGWGLLNTFRDYGLLPHQRAGLGKKALSVVD